MEIKIDDINSGVRVDVFLAREFGFSRKVISDKIEAGCVNINSKSCKGSCKLKAGDLVFITKEFSDIPEIDNSNIKPYTVPLNIVYEDRYLVIINKPAGLVTHPGAGNVDNTLVNALVNHFSHAGLSDAGGLERLGIVHRLDKDTSGLIVVAKNNEIHAKLSDMIKEKDHFERRYLALCQGIFMPPSGIIEKFMKKGTFQDGRMIIAEESDANARYSKTEYQTQKIFRNGLFSLMEFKLYTGRTHQIRLHCASLKHPILGDSVYSDKSKFSAEIRNLNVQRQLLHSYKMSFTHPKTNKLIEVSIELPQDMQDLIKSEY